MSIADRTGHPVRETRRTTNTFPVLMRRNHPIDRRSATQSSVTRNNVIARRIPARDDLLAHRVTQPGLLRLILLERNDLLTALRLQVIVTDEAAIYRLVDPRGYAVGTFGDGILAGLLDDDCFRPYRYQHIRGRRWKLIDQNPQPCRHANDRAAPLPRFDMAREHVRSADEVRDELRHRPLV